MTFRNRCTLSGPNGLIHLSIPLVGGRGQRTIIRDVKILTSENWQARHWKTITSVFNKSPWFEHYRDDLEKLYNRPFCFLVDWNLACFTWMADKMSINTPYSLSEKRVDSSSFDEAEKAEDWRNRLRPSTIGEMETPIKRYPQVFEDRNGFVPNLSILDYLFCAGNRLNKN